MISSNARTQDFGKNEPILRLKSGQPAPYAGILLDEPKYRYYVNERDVNFILSNELKDCHRIVQEEAGEIVSVSHAAAFILGALALYYAKH